MTPSAHLTYLKRTHAVSKFGLQSHPDGTLKNAATIAACEDMQRTVAHKRSQGILTWLDILMEEIREVAAEVDPHLLRAELADVAAVCEEWSEDIARRISVTKPSTFVTPDVELISRIVANAYYVTYDDLLHGGRPEPLATARRVAMTICRALTNRSQADIGRMFGGRDHGSVLHAETSVASQCETEPKLRAHYEKLLNSCRRAIESAAHTNKEES